MSWSLEEREEANTSANTSPEVNWIAESWEHCKSVCVVSGVVRGGVCACVRVCSVFFKFQNSAYVI